VGFSGPLLLALIGPVRFEGLAGFSWRDIFKRSLFYEENIEASYTNKI
jgi:hypothetical protein